MTRQRPWVVGNQTSSAWMAASFSNTALGVSPGACSCGRCFSVAVKQCARKATRMCASTRGPTGGESADFPGRSSGSKLTPEQVRGDDGRERKTTRIFHGGKLRVIRCQEVFDVCRRRGAGRRGGGMRAVGGSQGRSGGRALPSIRIPSDSGQAPDAVSAAGDGSRNAAWRAAQ